MGNEGNTPSGLARSSEQRPQRRHARANRVAIVESAIVALASDPDASMEEVAKAAGVVRRTVYAHFPSRADLMEGIAQEAFSELMAAAEQALVDWSDPASTMAELSLRIWPVGDRFRLLLSSARNEIGDDRIHALLGPMRSLISGIVARGQEVGVFSDYLPADLLVTTGEALTMGHLEQANRGLVNDQGETCAITGLVLLGITPERSGEVVARAAARLSVNTAGTTDRER